MKPKKRSDIIFLLYTKVKKINPLEIGPLI